MGINLEDDYFPLGIVGGFCLSFVGIIIIFLVLSVQDINNIWAKADLVLGILSLIIGLFLFMGFTFNKRLQTKTEGIKK